jgi:hypothetical protein
LLFFALASLAWDTYENLVEVAADLTELLSPLAHVAAALHAAPDDVLQDGLQLREAVELLAQEAESLGVLADKRLEVLREQVVDRGGHGRALVVADRCREAEVDEAQLRLAVGAGADEPVSGWG